MIEKNEKSQGVDVSETDAKNYKKTNRFATMCLIAAMFQSLVKSEMAGKF